MTDPAQPGQPPPPPPATPPPGGPPPAGQPPAGGNWGSQGTTPEWAQQTQNWRPAAAAPGPAPGVAYADLVMRIVAYIIDAIILSIIYAVIAGVLVSLIGPGSLIVAIVIGLVVLLVGSALYFIYTWMNLRASPGQKILGLMTVNEADGATLTQDQAIRRWAFLYGPSALATVFNFSGVGFAGGAMGGISTLIGLLVFGYAIYLLYTTANDPKRQGFHDKQARTVVVKAVSGA